jgi:lipid A 3-O-deacylase
MTLRRLPDHELKRTLTDRLFTGGMTQLLVNIPRRVRLFLAALIALPLSGFSAEEELRPWQETAVSVETGLLWQVGTKTPLSYRLVPTQLSWRSRQIFGRDILGGHVAIRNRFTLLGTWIQQGPESHYIAVNASPSIEWWNKRGTWCAYGGAGGGAGWLDSQGVRGGQGQDFTFNWFGRVGIEYVRSRNVRWNAGVMFQHMSNRGQTNPNPGVDAVGLTGGWVWSF